MRLNYTCKSSKGFRQKSTGIRQRIVSFNYYDIVVQLVVVQRCLHYYLLPQNDAFFAVVNLFDIQIGFNFPSRLFISSSTRALKTCQDVLHTLHAKYFYSQKFAYCYDCGLKFSNKREPDTRIYYIKKYFYII